MKSSLLFSFLLGLTSVHATAKEPKRHPQNPFVPPPPRMVLISFTFKMTDFAAGRVGGIANGIRDKHYNAQIPISYKIGQKCFFRRITPGEYKNPSEDLLIIFVEWQGDINQSAGYTGDISAATLKDIYGADAIVDVVEEPYEQVRREDEATKRLLILDALKKSDGDPLQAAERLRTNNLFLGEQNLEKKVMDCQSGASRR